MLKYNRSFLLNKIYLKIFNHKRWRKY